jgi:hypothetical protein
MKCTRIQRRAGKALKRLMLINEASAAVSRAAKVKSSVVRR